MLSNLFAGSGSCFIQIENDSFRAEQLKLQIDALVKQNLISISEYEKIMNFIENNKFDEAEKLTREHKYQVILMNFEKTFLGRINRHDHLEILEIIDVLKEYRNRAKTKVKLIIENKNINIKFQCFKKIAEEVKIKILKKFFSEIKIKYSPEY